MSGATEKELSTLQAAVARLNSEGANVSYRLIEIKGTYYIFPEFPAHTSEG